MTEGEVKAATCQIINTKRIGTGWLISDQLVLTALHCVRPTPDDDTDRAMLRFGTGSNAIQIQAQVVGVDVRTDACLLRLPEALQRRPLPCSFDRPRPGAAWYSFGFPAVKLQIGQVTRGTVEQILDDIVAGVDIDLSIAPQSSLSDYKGLSGAALMVGNTCHGFVRINLDNSLGAISCVAMRDFLERAGVSPEASTKVVDTVPIGNRPEFRESFVVSVRKHQSGYVLLDGAHGIGKSTFCQNFDAEVDDIEVVGVYAISDRSRGTTPSLQAQPDIFNDWLSTLRSQRATGRPARLADYQYSELIQNTHESLKQIAAQLADNQKIGLLFIDGLNEVDRLGGGALQRFLGLLPATPPAALRIVLTGVGFESFSAALGDLEKGALKLSLPPLDTPAQVEICRSSLPAERATPELIGLLCDLAQGHPLYLRYLLDLVSEGASDAEMKTHAAFSGAIEDYYNTIWAQLLTNADAVNLLAIVARLRWGVPTSLLTSMLTLSEAAVYVPTLARIRHLLFSPDQTTIYHSSFQEFLVHKTTTLTEQVQGRLATFCATVASGDYGVLNRVYHGLLGAASARLQALKLCDQSWVDSAVVLGAEPDLLLSDVDDALASATRHGTAVDIVRLLLLSQRLTFRYNTLFAQSADHVARALAALGKYDEAARHIVRYESLIVGPYEAFSVALDLITAGAFDQAIDVLNAVDREITRALDNGLSPHEFAYLAKLRLHLRVLGRMAGVDAPLTEFIESCNHVLRDPANKIDPNVANELMLNVVGEMLGVRLCLQGAYAPIASIPVPKGMPLSAQARSLISVLQQAWVHSVDYGVRLPDEPLRQLLADLDAKLDETFPAEQRDLLVVNALIEVGAKSDLVERYAAGVQINNDAVPLHGENRAQADNKAFDLAYLRQRAGYYLGRSLVQPVPQRPDSTDWEDRLSTLVLTIASIDGRARRAKGLGDADALNAIRTDLETTALRAMEFSLDSRTSWEDSYFIPEHVVPRLYDRLARLYRDCFGAQTAGLLALLKGRFAGQFGIYNEGFRRAVRAVVEGFAPPVPDDTVADTAFELLLAWRDYVLANVENRHELVPDLLQIVRLLVRYGASEEAHATYRSLLAVSMGPSWYKEDQLSLMLAVLSAIPPSTSVDASMFRQIAAYLERASGEVTFGRFVRYEKRDLLGELARRGLTDQAVKYFQHQTCGSAKQLFDQATSGDLDRVSQFIGMRYPGGALDEQAALLAMLKNLRHRANWKFRWALLEAYQRGDDRHLEDWGREYAAIIAALAEHATDRDEACKRLNNKLRRINHEDAWILLQPLTSILKSPIVDPFVALLDEIETHFSPQDLDRMASSRGVTRSVVRSAKPSVDAVDGAEASDRAASIDGDVEGGLAGLDDNGDAPVPGIFGQHQSIREANKAVESARFERKRNNVSAAIQNCVSALAVLQKGEWSVWEGKHSASEAEDMLKELATDGDKLAKALGALALEERHVQRWRIAAKLADLTCAKISTSEQMDMLRVAMEHIRHLVGAASAERFFYIDLPTGDEHLPAEVELLLWSLSHPNWERRDGALERLLWALRSEEEWPRQLVQFAVSQEAHHRADALIAIFDILSRENPVALWSRVAPHLDLAALPNQVPHVGRFSGWLRIAERAASNGAADALALATALRSKLSGHVPEVLGGTPPKMPSYVPSTLLIVWRELSAMGALNETTVLDFQERLVAACAPFSVEDYRELERGVSVSFREISRPLDRWEMMVRHALHCAVFPITSSESLPKVDLVLRVHNPETLVEPADDWKLVANLVQAVRLKRYGSYSPADDRFVCLHVHCWTEIDGKLKRIEMIPLLSDPGTGGGQAPLPAPSFRSVELPRPGNARTMAVCARVDPTPAHFGMLTPAIVTPEFINLIGANSTDVVRYHWRDSSSVDHLNPQDRAYENAVLAIKRSALSLPSGWKLRWILQLDGKHLATLERY